MWVTAPWAFPVPLPCTTGPFATMPFTNQQISKNLGPSWHLICFIPLESDFSKDGSPTPGSCGHLTGKTISKYSLLRACTVSSIALVASISINGMNERNRGQKPCGSAIRAEDKAGELRAHQDKSFWKVHDCDHPALARECHCPSWDPGISPPLKCYDDQKQTTPRPTCFDSSMPQE